MAPTRIFLVRHGVVSHKAMIRPLISSFLGIVALGYRDRLDQSPASLNILDFKDPVRARLMLYNDVSHYGGYATSAKGSLSKWWDVEGEGRGRDADRAR